MGVFNYDYATNCNPIPPSEAALPTVTAEEFVRYLIKFHFIWKVSVSTKPAVPCTSAVRISDVYSDWIWQQKK